MAEYVMDYDGWAEGMPIGAYLKVREAMHERKRERIVRCRDCNSFREDATPHDHERPHFCWLHGIDLSDGDGFCKWGVRRADG